MKLDSKMKCVLEDYMRDEKLTQEGLAERCGVKQATVSRYLSGKIDKLSFQSWRSIYLHIKEYVILEFCAKPLKEAMSIKHINVEELSASTKVKSNIIKDILSGKHIPAYGDWCSFKEYFEDGLLPDLPTEIYDIITSDKSKWKQLKHLRSIRFQTEISQSQLATLTGINQRTISSYEMCTRKPGDKHVETIAKALGVTPTELFEGLAVSKPRAVKEPLEIGLFRVKNLPSVEQDILKAIHTLSEPQKEKFLQSIKMK